MIDRILTKHLQVSLTNFPAVAILGSRQVGKTTLAKQKLIDKKSIYIDLELPSDLQKLENPEILLEYHSDALVIIDEIQRKPNLFPIMRALIDKKRHNGRFLLLGSASPILMKQASESLAGRIAYHELNPFCLHELHHNDANRLWLRGGYPESFLATSDPKSLSWRKHFIHNYIHRDIRDFQIGASPIVMQRFLMMLAHMHGQLWSASSIANSLGLSSPTIKHYLDVLDYTYVIRRLYPYYTNLKKRIIKTPKVYFRDTGLLHSLYSYKSFGELIQSPIAGASFEGYVIEQILRSIRDTTQAYFFRTVQGAEVDLVLQSSLDQKPIAIEIKYSLSPKLSKGFWNAFKDLKCQKGYVVYAGEESYPLCENVEVVSLSGLLEQLLRASTEKKL